MDIVDIKSLVDFDRLSAWMDRRGLGGGPLSDIIVLAGGTQNILLRFTREGRDYILRRPPLHLRKNSNAPKLAIPSTSARPIRWRIFSDPACSGGRPVVGLNPSTGSIK